MEVCEIVCETHQPIFESYLLTCPKGEPAEASVVFDLSEDGFDIGVALTAERTPQLRVQTFPCTSLQGSKAMTDLDTTVVRAAVALVS